MHNVGHALYDGLYPMFISMLRFGYGAADVNVVLKMVYNKVVQPGMHTICDDIAPVFGGGDYTHFGINRIIKDMNNRLEFVTSWCIINITHEEVATPVDQRPHSSLRDGTVMRTSH
mmetsp:Transcript_11755/g.9792  ORF Transcript_11755/g.9792 Transcript_11755/m.9792 type:complete len:116 (-) Transcript_11755:165-512(-)